MPAARYVAIRYGRAAGRPGRILMQILGQILGQISGWVSASYAYSIAPRVPTMSAQKPAIAKLLNNAPPARCETDFIFAEENALTPLSGLIIDDPHCLTPEKLVMPWLCFLHLWHKRITNFALLSFACGLICPHGYLVGDDLTRSSFDTADGS